MTNRDECISILNNFGEEQLCSVLTVLKSIKDAFDNALEEALDETYCQQLYQNYLNDPDPSKHDSMTLEDFADSLGISLS